MVWIWCTTQGFHLLRIICVTITIVVSANVVAQTTTINGVLAFVCQNHHHCIHHMKIIILTLVFGTFLLGCKDFCWLEQLLGFAIALPLSLTNYILLHMYLLHAILHGLNRIFIYLRCLQKSKYIRKFLAFQSKSTVRRIVKVSKYHRELQMSLWIGFNSSQICNPHLTKMQSFFPLGTSNKVQEYGEWNLQVFMYII